jgi:L-asparaginase/Glu-tRNA(Gln) amidotransferase subunit D
MLLLLGVVIVGYGTGNVSEPMYYAIQKAIKSGLKVILVTNCK